MSTIYVGVDVERFFRERRVRAVEHRSVAQAVAWAKKNPWAPHVLEDPGVLDRALHLVEDLERAFERRPLVVVISPSLQRGLGELGWRRSTYRVGFARSENLVDDLSGALDDLVRGEPELPGDVMDRERALDSADDATSFDVDALVADVAQTGAWAAGLAARVGGTVEMHATLRDLEGRFVATWLDPAGSRFNVSFAAALPPAPGAFSAWSTRGLAGALGGVLQRPTLGDARFDDAFQLQGDEAGLETARAVCETLAVADARVEELAVVFDRITARASRVDRDALPRVSSWLLELWRVVARHRVGADVDAA